MPFTSALYGFFPPQLAHAPAGAAQCSPLVPGAASLEGMAEASLDSIVMLAPPGTLERRYAMARALLALKPGGEFTVMALNTKGGARLKGELARFGCQPAADSKHHYRICRAGRPQALQGIEDALAEGGPQRVAETGLWSQPGIFSWNRTDPGSVMLASALPALSGTGADLGAGNGFLSLAVLASPQVAQLTMVESDRRAVEAARKNIADARARLIWGDARKQALKGLDFVVMNPPFHDAGMEDQPLGQQFLLAAAEALRPGGRCFLVANRHLPYEAVLNAAFSQVSPLGEDGGYKLYEARK